MSFSLILRKTWDNMGTEAQSIMWELRNWGLRKTLESGDKIKWEFPKQKGDIFLRREIVWPSMKNKQCGVREAARNCGYVSLMSKMTLWVHRGLAVKGGSESYLVIIEKPKTMGKHGRAGLGFMKTSGSGRAKEKSSLEEGDRPCPSLGSVGGSLPFSLTQTFAGQR